MEPIFNVPSIFNESTVGLVVKIFLLIATSLFIVFSFLTIRQVGLMNQTIANSLHFEVRLLAYFQLFLGIGVFFIILFLWGW